VAAARRPLRPEVCDAAVEQEAIILQHPAGVLQKL
jgi:hypothetical protein